MNLLPPNSRSWRTVVLAFAGAALIAVVWGSLVQTQFTLNALVALGVEMPVRLRLLTSAQDLVGFGPVYAGLVLAGWLPAFFVAAWLAHKVPLPRVVLFASTAGLVLVLVVRVADAVAPMPVLIDATRGPAGLWSMAAGSALGGAVFAWWTRK